LIHKCFQAQKNYSDFSVWGNGNALREFMYVEDLARIIERIESTVGKLPSKMIISPGKEHSIREVVQLIAKKFKFNGNIVFDETMPNGILRKPSDNMIFRNYFPDFEFTDLEKGINDTINWFTAKYPQVRL
jgi:GDP-L-fucose synthase